MPPSSWAKRTGFRPKFSGETNASDSGQIVAVPQPKPPPQPQPASQPKPREPETQPHPRPQPQPQPQAQPDLEAGRTRAAVNGVSDNKDHTVKKRRDSDGPPAKGSGPNGQAQSGPTDHARRPTARSGEVVDVLPNDDDGFVGRPTHMKYELRDTPGLGQFINSQFFCCCFCSIKFGVLGYF